MSHHITSHHDHSPPRTTYIKIKYHQLQANDLSNTRHPPIPCFTLGHTNHLVDILYHNPHDSHFPYLTSAHHIWSLLCQLPFIFFYDLSSSKSVVSQFLHDAYQVKILYYFTKNRKWGGTHITYENSNYQTKPSALWSQSTVFSPTKPLARHNVSTYSNPFVLLSPHPTTHTNTSNQPPSPTT